MSERRTRVGPRLSTPDHPDLHALSGKRRKSDSSAYRVLFAVVVKDYGGFSSRLVPGAMAGVAGPRVASGPGVACPKSRRSGCEPATLELGSFPGCPPGPSFVLLAARRASVRR